ncbi:phosphotransferase [Phytoactinopolyspora mesophila]|nr:phosphotransferase [Phytoactinopolyspora mesophila]
MGARSEQLEPSMTAVVSAFSLDGTPRTMTRVAGAWSHRVYRLETSVNVYAVKQILDPWEDPSWRLWLAEAWEFELAAFYAGVSMPRPVAGPDGGCLADVESDDAERLLPVRVHEWADATPCPAGPVRKDVAERLAQDLAKMHAVRHFPRRREVFPRPSRDNVDGWPELVERLRAVDPDLAGVAADISPWIGRVGELFDAADHDVDGLPMSHGDIDQKNVLLGNDGPVLCDWDVAMPWDGRVELARTAMSLARWERPDVAGWVITAYQSAGGEAASVSPQDLAVDLVLGVDWLVLCLERATGLRAADAQRQYESRTMISQLMAEVPEHVRTALNIQTWLTGTS